MTVQHDLLQVGYVSGLHGVSGWIKVYSYTDPPANIFDYDPWIIEYSGQQHVVRLRDSRPQGAGLVAKLADVDDRDQAAALVNAKIFINRTQLPETVVGEYYWADLVGLAVLTDDGVELGTVERLIETGANDVMIIHGDRERLVPWIKGDVVKQVDLENKCITVAWDPDF